MNSEILIKPIGKFHGSQTQKYESGRQPDMHHGQAMIELAPEFAEGLCDIESFHYIWILFQFHHNQHFKLKVMPPRGIDRKVGVFASRSPYRPNGIGMSAVRLIRRDHNRLYVSGGDLLDGTPILDIKPYVAEVDSMSDANSGWLMSQKYDIEFSNQSLEQIEFLFEYGVRQIKNFIIQQLMYEPTDAKRKRLESHPENHPEAHTNYWSLCYRTWRIDFQLESENPTQHRIQVLRVRSGYSENDLVDPSDPYQDKLLHREFRKTFT